MLLSWETYEQITGDESPDDDDVFEAAALHAQSLLEDALCRRGMLESDERTETLDYVDGLVYPTATPVTDAAGWTVHNDTLYGGTPDLPTWVGLIDVVAPRTVTVTYTGGFDEDTVPAYMLRDLAWVTYACLHPQPAQQAAANPGATAVSVGDVSVTYGGSGAANGGPASVIGVDWSAQTMRFQHRGSP